MLLPRKPRYPCPFITAKEIKRYLPALYKSGWAISAGSSPDIPSTMLAKSFNLESSEVAEKFIRETKETIIVSENHHPVWELQNNIVNVRVQTHSALAPQGYKNREDDDKKPVTLKRPGITLRDIRFAMLVERLLENDYSQIDSFPSSLHQPTDLDSVHNLEAL